MYYEQVCDPRSGNFRFSYGHLYPDEAMMVIVNNKIIVKRQNDTGFAPGGAQYFSIHDTIKSVKFLDMYKGKVISYYHWEDTLLDAPRLLLHVGYVWSRRAIAEQTYTPGFVSLDTGQRITTFKIDTLYNLCGTYPCP